MNAFEVLTELRTKQAAVKSPKGAVPTLKTPSGASLPIASLRATFEVKQIWGMHARPCAMLIKALRPFSCTVMVQCGDHFADARSILGLLSLAAGCHSKLTFTVTGNDTVKALAAVRHLFENSFSQA